MNERTIRPEAEWRDETIEIDHGGPIRALGECLLVLSPFVAARMAQRAWNTPFLGPVGVVACVLVATRCLRAHGFGWRDVGLFRPRHWGKVLVGAVAIIAFLFFVGLVVLRPVIDLFGLGQPNLEPLLVVRESRVILLIFLFPLSWGTAAFGEEMVTRGFLLHRIVDSLGGSRMAWATGIVLQAGVFGLAHSWQGGAGILSLTAYGVVFGLACFFAEGNLWPGILAHGTVDFVSILAIATGSLGG